jgi:hypothetical protein
MSLLFTLRLGCCRVPTLEASNREGTGQRAAREIVGMDDNFFESGGDSAAIEAHQEFARC